MPDVLYVPILKGRQGELAALAAIQPLTRQAILPVLEIVPGAVEEPERASQLRTLISRTAKRLETWAGSRLLLDAAFLPPEAAPGDEFGALGNSVIAAIDQGVDATPVVHLDDDPQVYRDAATLHGELHRGVALRLSTEDLDEDSEDIEDALTELLDTLHVERGEVDLILDLGAVNGDLSVRAGARLVVDVLRGLSTVDEWRNVIVVGGAFPSDLSAYEAWTLGEAPRYDATLYDYLRQRRRLRRIPTFGDYAVTHPILSGLPYRSAPHLRYCVADRWLVLKGRLNDPRGHDQFFEICERIAAHPDFAGAALGNADARIANPRRKGPGNASTWREVSTTHHLDFVVRRITTLGEP
ncbi:beta family protein [Trebonia sp.]|uniref:beta family protein n=1 Tax=Trebonia sp. TaxID=2767075 RepID=UPI00345BC0CD